MSRGRKKALKEREEEYAPASSNRVGILVNLLGAEGIKFGRRVLKECR